MGVIVAMQSPNVIQARPSRPPIRRPFLMLVKEAIAGSTVAQTVTTQTAVDDFSPVRATATAPTAAIAGTAATALTRVNTFMLIGVSRIWLSGKGCGSLLHRATDVTGPGILDSPAVPPTRRRNVSRARRTLDATTRGGL